MDFESWAAVDAYIVDHLVPSDKALDASLEASRAAGLPPIQVSPPQGKLLHLMARMHGARTILEIGTLGGYSAIWLARALPHDGRLTTLEIEPKHAQVARANIARAGLAGKVEIRVGRAIDSLKALHAEKRGPFDFVFIDADKPSTLDYYEWAVKLSRPGSVIVVDNVVREGAVVDEKSPDPNVQGIRRLFAAMSHDSRVSATAIQTVGGKSYDGFVVALVLGEV